MTLKATRRTAILTSLALLAHNERLIAGPSKPDQDDPKPPKPPRGPNDPAPTQGKTSTLELKTDGSGTRTIQNDPAPVVAPAGDQQWLSRHVSQLRSICSILTRGRKNDEATIKNNLNGKSLQDQSKFLASFIENAVKKLVK